MDLWLNQFNLVNEKFYYLSDEQGLVYVGRLSQLAQDRHQFFINCNIKYSNKKEYFQYFIAFFNHESPLNLPQHFFYGTPRQRQVWQTLSQIPWGATISYQALAQKAKQRKATRAVAHAVAQNPLMLLRPCHRIILKSGQVGQYRGGVDLKKRLLAFEAG